MPVADEELSKVPKGLELKEYYETIYRWLRQNKNRLHEIQEELKKHGWNNPKSVKISDEIIEKMPDPSLATNEDIVFVCRQILQAYLEWSYREFALKDVKVSAYAQYILDTFFANEDQEAMGEESSLYDILLKK